jgi:hypothetical protein
MDSANLNSSSLVFLCACASFYWFQHLVIPYILLCRSSNTFSLVGCSFHHTVPARPHSVNTTSAEYEPRPPVRQAHASFAYAQKGPSSSIDCAKPQAHLYFCLNTADKTSTSRAHRLLYLSTPKMKGVRRTIRSLFSKSGKSPKPKGPVAQPDSARKDTHSTLKTRIFSSMLKRDTKPSTRTSVTPDVSSRPDTSTASSLAYSDASPIPTLSSRTSAAASSSNAERRYKEEMMLLVSSMNLQSAEYDITASDSTISLGSDISTKQTVPYTEYAPASTATNRLVETEIDIFEEKRGASDIAVPRTKGGNHLISTSTIWTSFPPLLPASTSDPHTPSTSSLSESVAISVAVRLNHHAFLSEAEFAALPNYEDVEKHPDYNTYYERPEESFASTATVTTYSEPTCGGPSCELARHTKMGIDIRGEFHLLKQGTKRKESSVTTDRLGSQPVLDSLGDQSPSSAVKKRDCRVREKQIRGRLGVSMCTDEADFEWEMARHKKPGFYSAKYEAYCRYLEEFMKDDDDDDDDDEEDDDDEYADDDEVETGSFRYRGPVLQIVDDGFGGYGKEIF